MRTYGSPKKKRKLTENKAWLEDALDRVPAPARSLSNDAFAVPSSQSQSQSQSHDENERGKTTTRLPALARAAAAFNAKAKKKQQKKRKKPDDDQEEEEEEEEEEEMKKRPQKPSPDFAAPQRRRRVSVRAVRNRNDASLKKKKERKSDKKPIVLVSALEDADEKSLVTTILEETELAPREGLGALQRATHVVLGRPDARTLKVLFGLARGAWIISPKWVLESLLASPTAVWDDEALEKFENTSFTGARLSRKAGGGLLDGWTVYIHWEKAMAPPAKTLEKLVASAGGSTVDDPFKVDIVIRHVNDEDKKKAKSVFKKTGKKKKKKRPPVVSPEWLYESLSNYKIQDRSAFVIVGDDGVDDDEEEEDFDESSSIDY